MPEEKSEEGLTLDKRTMDVLVANIIPTSKYFEAPFDHMREQIDSAAQACFSAWYRGKSNDSNTIS